MEEGLFHLDVDRSAVDRSAAVHPERLIESRNEEKETGKAVRAQALERPFECDAVGLNAVGDEIFAHADVPPLDGHE